MTGEIERIVRGNKSEKEKRKYKVIVKPEGKGKINDKGK